MWHFWRCYGSATKNQAAVAKPHSDNYVYVRFHCRPSHERTGQVKYWEEPLRFPDLPGVIEFLESQIQWVVVSCVRCSIFPQKTSLFEATFPS